MGRKAYKWAMRDWTAAGDIGAARDLLNAGRLVRGVEPQVLDGPVGRRLLVLAPHPDDEVIGPGGTLIRAQRAGATVHVVYMTSGTAEEAVERRREAERLCGLLGFTADYLEQTPHAIEASVVAARLSEIARRFRPDALLLPFVLDDHEDHGLASEAAAQALRLGGLRGDVEAWAYQVYTALPANVAVEVTDLSADKAAAIRLYDTQMRRRDWAHYALGLNAFNCRLLRGRADACYVEAFFVLPLEDYVSIASAYCAPASVTAE